MNAREIARAIGIARYTLICETNPATRAASINVKAIAKTSKNSSSTDFNTRDTLFLKNTTLILTALKPSIFSMTTTIKTNISEICRRRTADTRTIESKKDAGVDAIVLSMKISSTSDIANTIT